MGRSRVSAPEGMKWCNRGQHFVEIERFTTRPGTWDGRSHTCRGCARIKDRGRDYYKRAYGIPRTEFEQKVASQDGRCDSCGDKLDQMHLDHCHITGQIRGVLCPNCNKALGMLKDDPERVSALLDYIRRWSS